MVNSLLVLCGAQVTTYQSEVQVNLIDKSEASESTDIKSTKVKRALEEKFTGVEFKTVPIGIMDCTKFSNRNGGFAPDVQNSD